MADPVIVAAGDIACPNRPCDSQRQTARLIGRIGPRAVLTLGDNQYDDGALVDYRASCDPTWGRFKVARIDPGTTTTRRANGYSTTSRRARIGRVAYSTPSGGGTWYRSIQAATTI
jgi:hypothetical protein